MCVRAKGVKANMSIFLLIGTRPQIIKSAPIIHESLRQNMEIKIIHTGQHYDYRLSQIFLEEFSLNDPIVNMNVGSGSHAFQTAKIMLRLEKYLIKNSPSMILIPGDSNSAIAGALTAVKLGIPVAHIEAGARCYDMKMAEEINRRLIDHCSEILFATTTNCKGNLEKESVIGEIYQTGDTMYDAFVKFSKRLDKCDIVEVLGLADEEYALLTLHRAENVDNPEKLFKILKGIQETEIKVVFPIHPRTKNRLMERRISFASDNIKVVDLMSYIEILKVLHFAKVVITDSGGLQKEAFWSKTPCVTIRDRTEWIETVDIGVNILTGTDPKRIVKAIKDVNEKYSDIKERFKENPFGDGTASKKISKILKEKLKI